MTIALVATATTVLALVALLAGERRAAMAIKAIAKPIASSGFIAVVLSVGLPTSAYAQAVMGALILSWFGDVLLLWHDRRIFLAGLVAFLLGHVGFCVAFVAHGVDTRTAAAAAVALTIVGVVIGRWLLPQVPAALRVPVAAYIVVISVMAALAAGTGPVVLGAAIAFYVSDLSVALDRFVGARFVYRAWGLPLYFGAQLVFAWTVAYPASMT